MSFGEVRRVKGVVLAGAHPWDEPSAGHAFLRPLAPVAHLPLVAYVIQWFGDGGISKATICANGASRLVRGCLGDGSSLGIDLDYYEDPIPRGPAGCALDASAISDAELFVVADGTIVPQVNLRHLLSNHVESDAAVTVVVSDDPAGLDHNGKRCVPTGIYVFHRRALEYIRKTGYQDTKEVLIPQLHLSGERVLTYHAEGPCPRVTDASTYLAVNHWRLEWLGREPYPLAGYRRVKDSQVHLSARLDPSATLIGPVLIGPNTHVGPEVTIVGPSSIGADCRVEAGAVVCRSVVWDRCVIGVDSIIDRCILRNGASIEGRERLHSIVQASRRRGIVNRLSRLVRRPKAAEGPCHEPSCIETQDCLIQLDGPAVPPARSHGRPNTVRREEDPECPPRLSQTTEPLAGQPAR
ncbi:MAG: NDP-sugar synthase [Phycisphaerae bacterium]|nr:NDP-sugar synthase [Phycisphaerae bacterium]